MHRLLRRQLKRIYGAPESVPAALEPLLLLVDEAYRAADEDRGLIDHALETVSQELLARQRELRAESARSRELHESKQRAEELALLQGTLAAGTQAPNLAAALTAMLSRMGGHLDWPWAEAWLRDGEGGKLQQAAIWHRPDPALRRLADAWHPTPAAPHGPLEQVRQSRTILHADDLTGHLQPAAGQAALAAGLTSAVIIPLVAHDAVIGVARFMFLGTTSRGHGQEDLLTIFGEQVATVVRRKQTEQELEESREQLLQSQKIEAIGRLAGGVAHDFNNLLTIIQGNTALALGELHDPEVLREYLDQIQWATERSAALTQQLLAFSRKQVLKPRVLNLNLVVRDMERMLHRLIGEHIELTSHLQADLRAVRADRNQLEQVILNLAVNARDAMVGGGRLTIETRNETLDHDFVRVHPEVARGEYVALVIRDTGCGMDRATQARIFEPFFTTRGAGRGTGLGLSTVYGIVKQSGGFIYVESAPGEGATFRLYLPQTAAEEPSAPLPEAAAAPHGLHAPAASGTILLVEDESGIRRLASAFLRRRGYTVIEAANGTEALVLSSDYGSHIDLLLTDVVMPQVNGAELARQLTRTRPGLRVLFMSGYDDEAIARLGVLDPGTRLLQKPFSTEELLAGVEQALLAAGQAA